MSRFVGKVSAKKGTILLKLRYLRYFCYFLSFALGGDGVDVTLIGPVKFADGIGRISLGILRCLQGYLSIQIEPRNIFDPQDVRHNIKYLIKKYLKPSNVALFTDPLFRHHEWPSNVLNIGTIKIAYSMFECSGIPDSWSKVLNSYFDAVVVPDVYLKGVYQRAGVKKPIFVIPCVSFLEDFLQAPPRSAAHSPFVFGTSGAFVKRKNQLKLLECFYDEFKDNDNVHLKIHGRSSLGVDPTFDVLTKKIQELNLEHRVKIINKAFSWREYIAFMKSLDCYVFISQGEGFSFTPREALALGIPCILTNNTTQTTLCDSGYIKTVPANIKIPADYSDQLLFVKIQGDFFDCDSLDVRRAMKSVYEDYSHYLNQAQSGRIWVQKYLAQNLRKVYINLVKPKKILLGNDNVITDDYLMTNNEKLFNKYTKVFTVKDQAPSKSV